MGLIMEHFHFLNIHLSEVFHFAVDHKKLKDWKESEGREGKEKRRRKHAGRLLKIRP